MENICLNITALSLILHSSDSAFLPPIYGWRDCIDILVHETPTATRAPLERPVVFNLGPSKDTLELMVSHVCKLVQLQFVRLILLVEVVNIVHVVLEHIEPLVLLVEVPRHRVMAPPPLVQIPQALLALQFLFMELETLPEPEDQRQRESK